MSGYGAKQYKQASVMTASRPQILIMLYEAAIRNVKKATVAMEKGDLSEKGVAIGKTHDIINELTTSLDFKVGGKLAEDLQGLYSFMGDSLLKANMENSVEELQSVQRLLETLLEGWRGAIAKLNGRDPSAEMMQERAPGAHKSIDSKK